MQQIESGVPLPGEGVPRKGRPPKYRFADMAVGDSFPFDSGDRERLRNSSRSHGRRHGVRFMLGMDDKGQHRIWRIA